MKRSKTELILRILILIALFITSIGITSIGIAIIGMGFYSAEPMTILLGFSIFFIYAIISAVAIRIEMSIENIMKEKDND